MPIKKVDIAVNEIVLSAPPEDEHYTLPKGVPWKAVGRDILDYGMFMFGNRTYMSRSTGKNARDEDTFRFTSVANFQIKIIQHMMDQKRASYLVQMENAAGTNVPFDTLTDEMAAANSFKKLCLRYGWFHWTGTQGDFDRLMGYLLSKMGSGSVVPYLGWQAKGGWFAFCNAGVNGSVSPYDKHGCVTIGKESYYVPSGNSIYDGNEMKHQNAKMVKLVENEIDFVAWTKQMYETRGDHGMVAVMFAVATLFSDWIFPIATGFPLLFYYGEGSTGKGVLIRAMQTLFGTAQPEITLTGKANTDKGKLRMFAEFINMMMFLDEYRNTLPDDMMEMIKQIWGRIPYRRGTIESEFGTENVPIRCTAALAGNYYPNYDDALLTRCIVDEFETVQLTDKQREREKKLKEMIAKGYSGIVIELVKHRKAFEKEFAGHFYTVKDEVSQLFGLQITADRMISNISVLLGTYKFLEHRFEMPFTYRQLFDRLTLLTKNQEDKRDQGNDVAHFWDCFKRAAKEDKLKLDVHFKIDGDMLSLFWSDVHGEYLKYHFEMYRGAGHSKTTMLDKLKKHPCWAGDKQSMWIGGRKSSAFQFNMKQAGEDMQGLITKRETLDDVKEKNAAEIAEKSAVKKTDVLSGASGGKQAAKADDEQGDLPF